MDKRLNFNATINLVTYILIGLTYVFKWSPIVAMIAFVLSIVVIGSNIVNLFLVGKEEKANKKIYIKRIVYQILIASVLVVIYIGRFNFSV